MGYLSVTRALSVRLLFASHGVVSIWRLSDVTNDSRYWYLSGSLGLLFIESLITMVKRQGKEWKWFCPSVFIYLLTSVPAIWFLELHEFDKRVKHHARLVRLARINNQTSIATDPPPQEQEDLSAPVGTVLGLKFEIRIPIKLTPDQWIRMLEQLLLLILILGRWLLPKGKLTHDQLSQLLLVYIGTAADIVEFFEAFKEKEVQYHKVLCFIILGIWSLSLVQFSLVLTASRARRDQSGLYLVQPKRRDKPQCCGADVFGIVISILLQDLPFLVLRMLLIIKYNVLSYTNMFFTSKNTLVIVLLIYRLVVIFVERRSANKDLSSHNSKENISFLEEDNLKVPETGSIFRRTAELKNNLLSIYAQELHSNSRQYRLKHEHHKYGRAYRFEEVDNHSNHNNHIYSDYNNIKGDEDV